MYSVLTIVLCIGAVTAASTQREKRQTSTCVDNVPNVCMGSTTQLYFPHPIDKSKFLQCAKGGRMFIITCPTGELYDQGSTSCGAPKPVVNPVTNPVTNPMNPCTPGSVALGQLFFAYPSDKSKFIECNPQGQPTVLSCPSRLVFDDSKKSCVLAAGTQVNTGTNTGSGTSTGTGGTATQIGTGSGPTGNPCTNHAATGSELFFPHPDPTKFIHCDLAGDAYVMQCPANLVWNQTAGNCAAPYTGVISGTVG